MNKRMLLATSTGALLGIFCIIGVAYRFGYSGNEIFIFSTWFNRLMMGIVIGLAGSFTITRSKYNSLVRGALLGLLISFSFYFATDFRDLTGFLAGIVYGIIIDFIATKYK